MEVVILEYNEAAFKRGINRDDIRHAVYHPRYNEVWDDTTDKHLLLGFDRAGSLLEIMYNDIDERTINVFHAMKCRNTYLKLLYP